jgi:transcriptional regulator with PAS, ATPase and Fis domain
MQAKLLRVLQEKQIRALGDTKDTPVNIRVIAATNENLEHKITLGEFREDLFFRLNIIPITVPSLQEHKEDIPQLINYFLKKFITENHINITIEKSVVESLTHYPWPGNIRQLENIIHRMATLTDSGIITYNDIPPEITAIKPQKYLSNSTNLSNNQPDNDIIPLKEYLRDVEISYINSIINRCKDKKIAAKKLNISLATLYRKSEQGVQQHEK